MSLFRGLIVLHIILAVELEPVQSVKLQTFQLTNQSCDSQRCEYCMMKEVPKKGNGGKVFQVVPILEKHWGGTRRNKAIPKFEDDRYITKDLMCKFLSFKEKVKLKDPDVDLKVVSGFRSVATQNRLFSTFRCQDTGGKVICASGPYHVQPGQSEHGDGIAVDIKTGCKSCKGNCDQDSHPGCQSKIMKAVRDVAHSDFDMPLIGSPGHLRLAIQVSPLRPPFFKAPTPPEVRSHSQTSTWGGNATTMHWRAGLPETASTLRTHRVTETTMRADVAFDVDRIGANNVMCCRKADNSEPPILQDMRDKAQLPKDPSCSLGRAEKCDCMFGEDWHSYDRYAERTCFVDLAAQQWLESMFGWEKQWV